MLFLEFGLARFFDYYQKQSFLSLGSDDTADMEQWCTATIIQIHQSHRQPASTIGIFFEIPLRRTKQQINKYPTHGVNVAVVQYSPRVRSIRTIDLQLALTQPEGKYSLKWDVW